MGVPVFSVEFCMTSGGILVIFYSYSCVSCNMLRRSIEERLIVFTTELFSDGCYVSCTWPEISVPLRYLTLSTLGMSRIDTGS